MASCPCWYDLQDSDGFTAALRPSFGISSAMHLTAHSPSAALERPHSQPECTMPVVRGQRHHFTRNLLTHPRALHFLLHSRVRHCCNSMSIQPLRGLCTYRDHHHIMAQDSRTNFTICPKENAIHTTPVLKQPGSLLTWHVSGRQGCCMPDRPYWRLAAMQRKARGLRFPRTRLSWHRGRPSPRAAAAGFSSRVLTSAVAHQRGLPGRRDRPLPPPSHHCLLQRYHISCCMSGVSFAESAAIKDALQRDRHHAPCLAYGGLPRRLQAGERNAR